MRAVARMQVCRTRIVIHWRMFCGSTTSSRGGRHLGNRRHLDGRYCVRIAVIVHVDSHHLKIEEAEAEDQQLGEGASNHRMDDNTRGRLLPRHEPLYRNGQPPGPVSGANRSSGSEGADP